LNSASSIAADTAQIVLMDDNLQQFPKLFELSESLESNYNSRGNQFVLLAMASMTPSH
jgi:cation transport ATPase